MNFLSFVFLIGLIVASLQDLKRREVDNWLNATLLVISISYLFYSRSSLGFFNIILFLAASYLIANLFYYGRIFAGGDAKLLFAMSALFISTNLVETFWNFGTFLVLLMVAGSIYGLFYSGTLYFKNLEKVNIDIRKRLKKRDLIIAFLFSLPLFILSFFIPLFLIISLLILFFPILILFSKSLEAVALVRSVDGKNLVEGDWLVKDVRVGNKTITSNWGGLTKKEIQLLKNKKNILIKDGIPFVPAFLIAFLFYSFFKDLIFGLLPI